jgi:hypothetical protein
MLGLIDRNASFFITKNFANCYIGDANHPELGKRIFLLYNYFMTVEYVKFERKLELMSEFSTDYDYADDQQVMYVFDIPEQYAKDFQLFLDGKYTEFSEDYKQTILRFWDVKDKPSIYYSVLYATDISDDGEIFHDLEGNESWPKPVLTEEIYMSPN